ncbi:MAG: hypothetical protein HDS03_03535 [Bacteroides sp.]|nr:hypothetical protein [Bacteroides sp.]
MKKFFLMLVVALPMFFMASCGDDNDDATLSLDQNTMSLDWSKTGQLTASEKNGVWTSTNDFVASVDSKGVVTANHEGKATIKYTKDGEIASCVVTVNTTNNYFTTITSWGATSAQVKNALKDSSLVLLEEDEDGDLMYTLTGNAYPWYGFLFQNGGLAGSSVYFPESIFDSEDFNGFIDQRFVRIDKTDQGVRYANANTLTEASEAVVVDYDTDLDVYVATFVPVTHTKADNDTDIFVKAKKLYRSAISK